MWNIGSACGMIVYVAECAFRIDKGAEVSNNDFNQRVIAEFRANGGKVGKPFENTPLILLTTIGAKSGQQRIAPLAYTADGDRIVIIASKGGAPTNPDWYYNLLANPQVTVEVGSERYEARATVAEGPERERLFNQMAQRMPGFAEYQRKTTREIPVVVLERVE
jgi:deazaflavin-dependent oxidoreductase (nitroreductase family)